MTDVPVKHTKVQKVQLYIMVACLILFGLFVPGAFLFDVGSYWFGKSMLVGWSAMGVGILTSQTV